MELNWLNINNQFLELLTHLMYFIVCGYLRLTVSFVIKLYIYFYIKIKNLKLD